MEFKNKRRQIYFRNKLREFWNFSALYNFHGEYHANGILKDNIFETQEYKQKWKTKQKSHN